MVRVPHNNLEVASWPNVARSLIESGWCRLTGAISAERALALAGAAPQPWQPLPEEEGGAGVRQAGFSAYVPLDGASPVVQRLGMEITRSLSDAVPAETARAPDFNEVQWSRYPAEIGHITAHRDPLGCGGVIAIATLTGQATFCLGGRGEPIAAQWETVPGDLVILRGNGWPTEEARCPMHGVEPPRGHERIAMTFRHNVGGAGVDYFSEQRPKRSEADSPLGTSRRQLP